MLVVQVQEALKQGLGTVVPPPAMCQRHMQYSRQWSVALLLYATLVMGLAVVLHPKSSLMLHPVVKIIITVVAVTNGLLAILISVRVLQISPPAPVMDDAEVVIIPRQLMLSSQAWNGQQ